jgi:ABC-2 type transport system permease protein
MITVVAMPVFMLLFFVYVIGGNIALGTAETAGAAGTNGGTALSYVEYSLPGFLLIAMTMGSAYTAVRINMDKSKGFLARLQSLPIRRWVILGSHVVASVVFMLVAEVAVLIVGLVIGYRPHMGAAQVALFGVISVLFAFAITLLAVPFSLKAKDYASASGFSYVLLMLLFVSSALMPTAGMAAPVRAFAKYQPMTPIVEYVRSLLDTGYAAPDWAAAASFGWLAALIIVFGAFSYKRYLSVFGGK